MVAAIFSGHNKQRHHVRKPSQSHEAAKPNTHTEHLRGLQAFNFFPRFARCVRGQLAKPPAIERIRCLYGDRIDGGDTENKKTEKSAEKRMFLMRISNMTADVIYVNRDYYLFPFHSNTNDHIALHAMDTERRARRWAYGRVGKFAESKQKRARTWITWARRTSECNASEERRWKEDGSASEKCRATKGERDCGDENGRRFKHNITKTKINTSIISRNRLSVHARKMRKNVDCSSIETSTNIISFGLHMCRWCAKSIVEFSERFARTRRNQVLPVVLLVLLLLLLMPLDAFSWHCV